MSQTLNDLLDGDLCKKILLLSYVIFFWFSNMLLSDALILTYRSFKHRK